jgi:hypothetical protein
MRSRRHSSFVVIAALLALLGLGLVAEESFVHTDDGCAVEIHCVACRLAVAGTAVVAPALDVAPRPVVISAVAIVLRPAALEAAPRTFEPRGPPLA